MQALACIASMTNFEGHKNDVPGLTRKSGFQSQAVAIFLPINILRLATGKYRNPPAKAPYKAIYGGMQHVPSNLWGLRFRFRFPYCYPARDAFFNIRYS
jgi:hypothetical protein